MRNWITGILFLFVLVPGVVAQADRSWVKVEPENGGFAAMMPAKPDEQIDAKEKITTHAYIAQLGRGIYLVSYSDYDASLHLEPQTELEADRDNFNKVLSATLVTSRNITFEGRQGIEFTSETPAANIRSKVFIRGNRVFQQAVMIWKDLDQTKSVEAFFDSFAFTTKN